MEDKTMDENTNIVTAEEGSAVNATVEETANNNSDKGVIPGIADGPEQSNASEYEKYDYSHRPLSQLPWLRFLKPLTYLAYPFVWAVAALRNLLVTAGMDSKARERYFKEMSERAAIEREKATKETPYVANKKMEIVQSIKDMKNEEELKNKLSELAYLCHDTGCTFYVILEDRSAIQFTKNEKYVEMSFSEKPQKINGQDYETYVFGTSFGNVRYRTTNEWITSRKPSSININTVMARVVERGGFSKDIDTLKSTAGIVKVNEFVKPKDAAELGSNPGHDKQDALYDIDPETTQTEQAEQREQPAEKSTEKPIKSAPEDNEIVGEPGGDDNKTENIQVINSDEELTPADDEGPAVSTDNIDDLGEGIVDTEVGVNSETEMSEEEFNRMCEENGFGTQADVKEEIINKTVEIKNEITAEQQHDDGLETVPEEVKKIETTKVEVKKQTQSKTEKKKPSRNRNDMELGD